MKNWTIKKRIVLGFTTLLVLVALLAVTTFTLLRQVKAEADYVSQNSLLSMAHIADVNDTIGQIQVQVMHHLMAKTPEEK
jgi:CHASE3 domain sensor protein